MHTQDNDDIILRASPDGFYIVDTQGNILEVNDAYCLWVGYSRDELLAMNVGDLDALESQEEVVSHIQRILETGSHLFETRHRCKDGTTIDLDVSASYLDIEGGQIYAFLRDITARRADKTQKTQMLAALGESEEKYRALFESSSEAITLIGLDGTVLDCNPATSQISGMPRKDLIGRPFAELGVLREADIPQYYDLFQRMLGGETAPPIELEIIHSDDSSRWLEILAIPLKKDGTVHAIQVVARDVTSRVQVESELRARARQQAAVAELGQLALAGTALSDLMDRAVALVAQGVTVEYSKILELDPDGQTLLLRAGVGWRRGLVGEARVGTGVDSQAGYTLLSKEPVIVPDLRTETRFSGPPLLHEHGVVSGLSVAIPGQDQPWGVLGAHTTKRRTFTADDVNFMCAVANVVADAVERKRVEGRVQKSEEQYRSLIDDVLDASAVGVVILDADLKVVWVNQALERYLCLRRDEIIGKDKRQLVLEQIKDVFENPESYVKRLFTAYENNAYIDNYECHVLPSGERQERWLELRSQPIQAGLYAGGRIDQYYGITKRKQAETEQEHLLTRIQQQAQQMQQIVQTVPEGVLLLDADGCVRLVNPAAREYLSMLANVQVGDVPIQLGDRLLADLLAPPPLGLWHQVTEGNRFFEAVAQPLAVGPQIAGWVLVIRDVTQERDVQRRVQQQERLAAVGQLAAGIAHDFNNIMAAIVLYTEIALRATPDMHPKSQRRLATVIQQAKQASDLIQQILDFSRRAVIERRPLSLVPLLKEQVKLLERTLPENIHIELAYGADEYTVNADPTRIQQAVMNLALNARDAMSSGGKLQIELARLQIQDLQSAPLPDMPIGEWVRITMSDTGTGILAEILPHIYEPFFTTKPPGKGSGLGLAQVYGIVKQHQGEIDVVSQVGRGTIFSIFLPALPETQPETSEGAQAYLTRGSGETILVVEDNPVTREALVDTLEMLNYRAVEAADGREALALLEQRRDTTCPDEDRVALVLSDLVMPEIGGLGLLQAITQKGLNVPVLVLTGHPVEDELERLRTYEESSLLVGLLLKPPNLKELSEVLARTLSAQPPPA